MKMAWTIVFFVVILATGRTPAFANLVINGNFIELASGVLSPGAHVCENGSAAGSTCASSIVGWQATCSSHGCVGTNSPGSILLNGTSGNGWNGNTGYTSYIGFNGTIGNAPGGGNAVAVDAAAAVPTPSRLVRRSWG